MAMLAACGDPSAADLIAAAKTSVAKNDDKGALVQLKTALQKDPQSAQARFLLGDLLLRVGDAPGALIELNKARDLKYDDNLVLPRLAYAQLANGQTDQVIKGSGQSTLSDPKAAAELKSALANAYAALKMPDRSAAEIDAALKLDPKNTEARLLHARLTGGKGAFDDALAEVQAVIADDPKSDEAWLLKGQLLWVAKSDFEGADKALRQAIAIKPTQMAAYDALLVMAVQRNDVATFKTEVAEVRKRVPDSFQVRFYTAQLALLQNDLKAASEGSQQLLKLAPQFAPVLQLAGVVELKSNQVSAATAHLAQAVQLAPDVPAARKLLAEAYLRSGQPAKVAAALQPLVSQDKPDASALSLLAAAYAQQSDMAGAETYYALAAKAQPDSARAAVALAMAEMANGKTDAGFSRLQESAKTSKSSFADQALVAARVRANDLAGALSASEALVAKAPEDPMSYVMRGRVESLRKDNVAARASLEKAVSLDPVNFAAVAALAEIDVHDNQLDAAAKRYEALLSHDPKNMAAQLALADLRARQGAKPDDVEALLAKAARDNPYEVAPSLALVNFRLDHQHAKAALAAAQDAAAAQPDSIELLDALGRAQLAVGDTQQAQSTFQRVGNSHPTSPAPFMRLAEDYAGAKDYANAEKFLRKALEIAPKQLTAQRALVQLLTSRKRFPEAVQAAREIQKQQPTEAIGYVIESDVQVIQRAWDPAIQALRAGLERDKSSGLAMQLHRLYQRAGRNADAERFAADWLRGHPKDADFIFDLGTSAEDRQDWAGAEARYRQVLTTHPGNGLALNNLANVLLTQHKPGALDVAQQAQHALPDSAFVMDTLATALASEKQYAQALEWQKKAVAREPDTPGYRLDLARRLIDAGDRAQAKVELEKLATLGGRYSYQSQVTDLLKGL
ncbi:MAG: PEP-CTERM system TPR-repeat protein PrsT [Burkholderiales bacterium]|nr:PEP-CTERM system TPR-repeat protein PrsT [Burkholderiales bacterium]